MAKLFEINKEAVEWKEWIDSRPDEIRAMIEKWPPNLLYLYKPGNHRVTLHSYSEDGTVTIDISSEYNLILFSRHVFGINPEDLEECDLPADDEILGEALNEEQAMDYINTQRADNELGPLPN